MDGFPVRGCVPDKEIVRDSENVVEALRRAEAVRSALSLQSPTEGHGFLSGAMENYAIYTLDLTGRLVGSTSGTEDISGYASAEIIGQHFSIFFSGEDRAAGIPEALLKTALDMGKVEREGWLGKRDGTQFWATIVMGTVKDEGEHPTGIVMFSRDMTERRLHQAEIAAQEHRFRLLVDGVLDYAIYMLDPNGNITNWNNGAQRIKGYSAQEILGKHFSIFFTEEDRAKKVPEMTLGHARENGKYEAEGWRVRKDGSRFWANVILDAIFDDNAQLIGFAKVTRDITERREAQQTLEQAREQLFHSQKMEAIGQLTGGMAHDFNNLLTIIISGADLASRSLDKPERLKRLLENMKQAARHGENLTKHLLAFSRKQPLQPELIDLKECLNDVADSLLTSLSGDITIRKDMDPGLWKAEVDLHQLHLALLNIALNARDAMPAGGEIVIRGWNQLLPQKQYDLNPGEYVAISVADTGTGIPANIRDRIFDPFFTTKSVGRGTGLGLSQAYGFAKQSGGSMSFSSVEGQGTIMTIYLPASRPQETIAALPDKKAVVLVVEDDVTLGDLSTEILTDAGYQVVRAHNAHRALEILRTHQVDIMLSDIVMPGGINGLELVSQVEIAFPDVKCVLTTGFSPSLALPRRQSHRILMKPFDQDTLVATIDALIA